MPFLSMIAAGAAAMLQPQASEASVAGPSGPLRGTLLAPAGRPHAAILIIPGSGPTDRDGNSPLGITAASYRLLAEALAERGVASVRIDKRGMFGSQSAIPDANAVTIADYAGDVGRWVPEVRARTGASCVWLLGHSEGGLVAMAARAQPGVCGLILVAAPGRPLGEVLREQLRANPANAPILEQALAAITQLEAGRSVDASTLPPALLGLFAPQVQGFLIDLLSQDPPAMLRGYERPVLIVQGLRDLQVAQADAARLHEADPSSELALVPNVTHTLKEVGSDDRAANLATYGNSTLPIAPGVVNAIAAFLERQSRRP